MCTGRIAGIPLTFAFCELSLPGNATFQSGANFLTGRFLKRIGTAGEEGREKECDEEERPGLHLLILGNNDLIANSDRTISNRVG
jgi:hypothetical protein